MVTPVTFLNLAVLLLTILAPAICQIPYQPCSPVNYLAAYPGDCGRFLACATFGYVPMDCPANLAFNEPRQVCDYRNFVPGCSEETTSRCNPNPCGQYGTCIETPLNPKGFVCNCQPGYDGDYCTLDINECVRNNPCERGTCFNTVGSFTCDCGNSGYTGKRCETPPGVSCINGQSCRFGQCNVASTGNTCICEAGYTGTLCDTDINECSPNPCRNNGKCTNQVNGFSCNCTGTGFHGTICSEPDACVGNLPCQFGTCINSPIGSMCACQPGYTGPICESETASCNPNPCFNGGTCTPTRDGFECDCSGTGYTGNSCEQRITTPSPFCSGGVNCIHGECIRTISGSACDCDPGYTGNSCEIDINECSSNPCLNGGRCVDGIDSYTCSCSGTGFSGNNCEVPVTPNPCAINPCVFGRCLVQQDSTAKCDCTGTGYTGDRCDIPGNSCPPVVCPSDVPRHNYPAWNDTSCASYYNCEYGILNVRFCPPSQKFDVVTMRCQNVGDSTPRFFCDSLLI